MRSVLVTGGSRGLGLGIARALSRSGYSVVAVARQASPPLEALNDELRAGGHEPVRLRTCDLQQTAVLPGFVRGLLKEFGTPFALINNAGIGTSGILAMMRDSQIEALLQTNVLAPLLLTKYVVRAMMAARVGRIINVSSIVSFTGYSGLSAYAASKSALIGFTRSLAREVGPLGITVNAIAPGFLDTEMTGDMDTEARERIIRRSALRRQAAVEDVAGAVEYLLSERARNVTGTVLTVDAGATA
jgi:3-oxoacyl-[acyl-carrier protein] reductase